MPLTIPARCSRFTAKGYPCKNLAQEGSALCHIHNPVIAEVRNEAIREYHKQPNPMPTSGYAANKRWRLKHPKARAAQTQRYYASRRFGNRRDWTVEELDMLRNCTQPDTELASQLNRSIRSIQMKRGKLKRRDGTVNGGTEV